MGNKFIVSGNDFGGSAVTLTNLITIDSYRSKFYVHKIKKKINWLTYTPPLRYSVSLKCQWMHKQKYIGFFKISLKPDTQYFNTNPKVLSFSTSC